MAKIFHLLYTSQRAGNKSADDIRQILQTSKKNNRANGITGILLYRSGLFLQLLEGPKIKVLERLAKIAKDPRHTNVRVLIEFETDSRILPIWKMGHIDESQFRADDSSLPENFDWLLTSPKPEKEIVLEILRKFAEVKKSDSSPDPARVYEDIPGTTPPSGTDKASA